MTFYSEVHRMIGMEGEKGALHVVPGPDGPDDLVLLFAKTEDDKIEYGDVYLQLDRKMMRKVGQALLDCCDDLDRAEHQKRGGI